VRTNLRVDALPWHCGARWQPATFFVRETKALEQMADCRMLNLQSRGIGKCVTQFKQRDVRVLRDQFFEKADMWGQLT
jgi:hypothetical protein